MKIKRSAVIDYREVAYVRTWLFKLSFRSSTLFMRSEWSLNFYYEHQMDIGKKIVLHPDENIGMSTYIPFHVTFFYCAAYVT